MSLNIDKVNTVLTLMPDKHMGNLVVSLPAIDALIKQVGLDKARKRQLQDLSQRRSTPRWKREEKCGEK